MMFMIIRESSAGGGGAAVMSPPQERTAKQVREGLCMHFMANVVLWGIFSVKLSSPNKHI